MEENSALWLALREAGRRVLSGKEIIIEIPAQDHERWYRLILNMSDALPQRISFPSIIAGENLNVRNSKRQMIMTNQQRPDSLETLWLPVATDIVLPLLEQMCAELLLAGYPGCEGCGFRQNEDQWNEELSRKNLVEVSQ